jgi:hypothetical protein
MAQLRQDHITPLTLESFDVDNHLGNRLIAVVENHCHLIAYIGASEHTTVGTCVEDVDGVGVASRERYEYEYRVGTSVAGETIYGRVTGKTLLFIKNICL